MRIILEIIGFLVIAGCIADLVHVDYTKPHKKVYQITKSYKILLAVQAALLVLGLALILQSIIPAVLQFGELSIGGKIAVVIRIVVLIIVVIIGGILYKTAISPNGLIHFFVTHANPAGDGEKLIEKKQVWEEQYYLTSDVEFPSKYPHNYFDIYTRDEKLEEKRPVFLYAHGGGYVGGNKSNGDPNAMGITGIIRMIKQLLDAGFTVISTDYALAPESRYPAPVHQMTELIQYLQRKQEAYGLDMNRVVLGGGSAGAHIMAQFAVIQTNPDYAKEMGVKPVLEKGAIRAMYHGCALLDNERFGKTSSKVVNFVFYQMGRTYFNVGVLEGNTQVLQSNIICHVDENYPPSFICDGNAGTFNAQAHDLEKRLNLLGVETKAIILDEPGMDKMVHGFDTLENEQGRKCMEAMVAFVSSHADL